MLLSIYLGRLLCECQLSSIATLHFVLYFNFILYNQFLVMFLQWENNVSQVIFYSEIMMAAHLNFLFSIMSSDATFVAIINQLSYRR